MAYLVAVMNQVKTIPFHQLSEFHCHGFGMAVSHGDRDKGAGIGVRFEISLNVLGNELGMFFVIEGVGSNDDLARLSVMSQKT
jgi:hypothetical protein